MFDDPYPPTPPPDPLIPGNPYDDDPDES